jgi:hypothetical protein
MQLRAEGPSLLIQRVYDGANGADLRNEIFAEMLAEMLAEMPREARDAASLSPPRLPLTDRVGFGMQLVCDENGAVVFESGFNSIRKARSWAAFLELVLQDTV